MKPKQPLGSITFSSLFQKTHDGYFLTPDWKKTLFIPRSYPIHLSSLFYLSQNINGRFGVISKYIYTLLCHNCFYLLYFTCHKIKHYFICFILLFILLVITVKVVINYSRVNTLEAMSFAYIIILCINL